MPSLIALLLVGFTGFVALAGQTAPNELVESTRQRLDSERRELLTSLDDKAWMQDEARATLARLKAANAWKACAENEAFALARASEKPARVLAESALTVCRPWQTALELALKRGAYPYVEGPGIEARVSRDDMVMDAQLASLDAALARIRMWRGMGDPAAKSPLPARDPYARISPRIGPVPAQLAPAEPPREAPVSIDAAGETVTIVAQAKGGCRVRLADRTLTPAELEAKAREWAAAGTALKVVRPRGGDYRCMSKIAWQLGEYGLRFFEFVEPR